MSISEGGRKPAESELYKQVDLQDGEDRPTLEGHVHTLQKDFPSSTPLPPRPQAQMATLSVASLRRGFVRSQAA